MYRPHKSASTFKDEDVQAIWAFLNEAENLLRMVTASALDYP